MTPKITNISEKVARLSAKSRKSIGLTVATMIAMTGGATQAFSQEDDDDVFVLDAFVVENSIRESLIKGVEIKRESKQMVDVLIAEDIGKFPDNNVVEALQRVSGVQVTNRGGGEVSSVSIRGLNDIATTVNGRNIFTASGRSVALADIPASLLNRVDVFKTRSAEQIEQGIAGVIDVRTQRPFFFDGPRAVLAVRGIHQEQAGETDPNISALFTNTWDLGDGARFGALINLSYAETNYKDQSTAAGAMVPYTTDNPPAGYNVVERIFPTRGGVSENPIWEAGLEAGLPFAAGSTLSFNGEQAEYILNRDAVFQTEGTGHRERPAVNVSLQYAPDDKAEYTFEAFYNGYSNITNNSLRFAFVDWWNDQPDAWNDVELYPGTNVVAERTTYFPWAFTSGDYIVGNTDSYLYALGGKWDISDKFKLEADLSFQDSKYEESFFALRFNDPRSIIHSDYNDGRGVVAWQFGENDDLNDLTTYDLAELYDNGLMRKGDAMEFTIDGDYNADWGIIDALRFGLRYDDRGATEANRFGPAGGIFQPLENYPELAQPVTGFFDGRANVPTEWYASNGEYIYNNADEIRALAGFPLSDEITLTENFEISEVTTTAYVTADFNTEVSGKRLDGEFGLRYVNVDTDMAFAGANESVSKGTVLPSFTARYDFNDQFRARFSYGETLRRPNFADLNPTVQYNEDVTNVGYGTAGGGNPFLRPTESKNYDLSFEYYMGEQAGAVYTTFFKRKIDGLVVSFRNRVNYEGEDYILTQPDNASNGELEGVEFGWVYFPEELPGIFDGFGMQASYTILDSIQDIPVTNDAGEVVGTDTSPFFGVSDSSYSVVLAYEKERFSTRLSYVWRDNFKASNVAALFANPLGVYNHDEESLDFQLSYNVSDNLVITLDATNLTEPFFQNYYEYPDTHNSGTSIFSRTVAMGARYSF